MDRGMNCRGRRRAPRPGRGSGWLDGRHDQPPDQPGRRYDERPGRPRPRRRRGDADPPAVRHRVGQPRRAAHRRRGADGAGGAGPPERDAPGQHRGGAHRPGPRRAGGARGPPRHGAGQRQLPQPPRRGGGDPARAGHLRHEGRRRGDPAPGGHRARAGARRDLRALRGRGDRGGAQRAQDGRRAAPRPARGRLRDPDGALQRRRRGRLPGHPARPPTSSPASTPTRRGAR